MAGRQPPGPPREAGTPLLFLAFPVGNPTKVSPGILPLLQPRAGGPPRPASPPQGEVGPAGARGRRGPRGGQSSPVPPVCAAPGAGTATSRVLGTPRAGGPGQPGDPCPSGVPPAQGNPCGYGGDKFHPPEHPTGSALPSELPRADAGPSNACRLSPWRCSGTPTRGTQGRWRGAEAPGCVRLAALAASSRREKVSRQGSPRQCPRSQDTPRALCRGTEPGLGHARRGCGVASEWRVFTCTRRHLHPRQGLP